jgi:hypothetical protein
MYINDVLGGEGDASRQTNFNSPTKLAANEDYLAVYDSGNKVIKLYSSNLDFIKTFTIIQLKQSGTQEEFQTMGFDPDFNSLYVLTKLNKINVVLYRINISTREVERIELNDNINENDIIRNVSFSDSDSNYWFYNTNRRIFKKYKTEPTSKGVGDFDESGLFRIGDPITEENRYNKVNIDFDKSAFLWNLILSEEDLLLEGDEVDVFKSFNILKGSNGNDRFNILTSKRFYFFDEPTFKGYKKVIRDDNYDNYGTSGFSLNSREYIQIPVINNELYKVVYDLLALKNNIVGRFAGEYRGDDIILLDYDYVDLSSIKEETIENYFVHFNEENTIGALNRVIKKIYETQLLLTNIIKVQPTGISESSNFYIENPDYKVDPEFDGILTLGIETIGSIKKQGEKIRYKAIITNIGSTPVEGVFYEEDALYDINITYDPLNVYGSNQSGIVLEPKQVAVVEYEYEVSLADASNGFVYNSGTATALDREDVRTVLDTPVLLNTDISLTAQLDEVSTGPYYKGGVIDYKIKIRNNGLKGVGDISVVPNELFVITTDPSGLLTGSGSLSSGQVVTATFRHDITTSSDVNMSCDVSGSYLFNNIDISSNTVDTNVIDITDGADVAFVVDYTYSMKDSINDVKSALFAAESLISDNVDESQGNQYDLSILTSDHGNTIQPFLTSGDQNYSESYFSKGAYQSLESPQKKIEDTGYDTGKLIRPDENSILVDLTSNIYYYHTCWKQFQQPSVDFETVVNKLGTDDKPIGAYGYINYTPRPNSADSFYIARKFAVTEETDFLAPWNLTPNDSYELPPSVEEMKLLSPWASGNDRILERILENDFAGFFEDGRVKVIVLFTDTFNCVTGNNPSGSDNVIYNTRHALPIFESFNLIKLLKVKALATEQKIKIVVLGPGVDISLSDLVEPGSSTVINGIDYTNYYPWRDLATATGGITKNTISAESIEEALEYVFDIN